MHRQNRRNAFGGQPPDRVRELAICIVARETRNQFEWLRHAPLALKAGVAAEGDRLSPAGGRRAIWRLMETCAVDFVTELMHRNQRYDLTPSDHLVRQTVEPDGGTHRLFRERVLDHERRPHARPAGFPGRPAVRVSGLSDGLRPPARNATARQQAVRIKEPAKLIQQVPVWLLRPPRD